MDVDDVLLQTVADHFQELVTYIQCTMPSISPSSSSCRFDMVVERLLLLHHRSQDVLADFSGYSCLSLLLDERSPLATYFIDMFYQLEWLLKALVRAEPRGLFMGEKKNSLDLLPSYLEDDLYSKAKTLLACITPAMRTCRTLFLISEITNVAQRAFNWDCSSDLEELVSTSKQCDKKILGRLAKIRRQGRKDRIHMKRQANKHRKLPMDRFHARLQGLPFVNLDECSRENRVELRKKLGEGSYAVVYEGSFVNFNPSNQIQQTVGQPVAVKVFRRGESEVGSKFFSQMEAMFQPKESAASKSTESKTTDKAFSNEELQKLITAKHPKAFSNEELQKLITAKHPNVVSARGYIGSRPEGESGLVMELMSTTLQEYLEKIAEPLQELEKIDLMLEIAKGMRFLHECDLVHRDLKPQNVLLRFSDQQLMINGASGQKRAYRAVEVKLADFGLAQRIRRGDAQVSGNHDTCECVGTYCYMAPELLEWARFWTSDMADVFSYGTICFNILTCKDADALHFTRAYSKKSAAGFYEAVRSSDWRTWAKGKQEYLVDLISRCWAFDARKRPTFAAICCLLQRAILCIVAPPVISEKAVLKAYSPDICLTAAFLRDLLEEYEPARQIGNTAMLGAKEIRSRLRTFLIMCQCKGIVTYRLLRKFEFLYELKENATTFQEQWINKGSGMMSTMRCYTLQAITILQRGFATTGPSAAPYRDACNKLKANIADQNYVNSSNTYTNKTGIWLERNQGADQRYLHIPLTTMNPEWNIFRALVCSSFMSYFPFFQFPSHHDFLERSRIARFDKFNSKINVDETLMPFLECLYEIGTD